MTKPIATSIPAAFGHYSSSPVFTERTVPEALLKDHDTKAGVWGLIGVTSGSLRYRVTDPRRISTVVALSPDDPPGIIEPTIQHRVELIGKVEFRIEFYK